MRAYAATGDGFWEKVDELGHVHELSILYAPLYLTTDANIVKVCMNGIAVTGHGLILLGYRPFSQATSPTSKRVRWTRAYDVIPSPTPRAGADFRDTMHTVLGQGVFNADGMFFLPHY